jgi:septal ring factor EnvC (AmiA/AmiB activator)
VKREKTMRAFHGQMSDNQPIRRSLAEKQKQLRELKETLASMKSHTAPTLRESVRKRIAQLEAELAAAPALKAGAEKTAEARGGAGRGAGAAGENRSGARGGRRAGGGLRAAHDLSGLTPVRSGPNWR